MSSITDLSNMVTTYISKNKSNINYENILKDTFNIINDYNSKNNYTLTIKEIISVLNMADITINYSSYDIIKLCSIDIIKMINNYIIKTEYNNIDYNIICDDILKYLKLNKIEKKYNYSEFINQYIYKEYPNGNMIHNELINLNEKREIVNKLKNIPLVEQKSKEWYEFRRNRITASNVASVFNKGFKNRHDCLKNYVEDNMTFTKYKATQFGIKYEDVACDFYKKIKNVNVHEFGCLPHPQHDYLAASPDGITDDGVMLEIKCPYSRDIIGIPPIYYWYQMQLQLEVCNLNECDYLECKIEEYANEEEYNNDKDTIQINNLNSIYINNPNWRDIALEKKTCFKGIVIDIYDNINDKNNYIYYNNSDLSYKDWINKELEKIQNKENKFITISYWKLKNYYITRIYRDKQWFDNNLNLMKQFWDDVLYYRNNRDEFNNYLNDYKNKQKIKKYNNLFIS